MATSETQTTSLSAEKRQEIDILLDQLSKAGPSSLEQRMAWVDACLPRLAQHATDWVDLS